MELDRLKELTLLQTFDVIQHFSFEKKLLLCLGYRW